MRLESVIQVKGAKELRRSAADKVSSSSFQSWTTATASCSSLGRFFTAGKV